MRASKTPRLTAIMFTDTRGLLERNRWIEIGSAQINFDN